MKSLLEKVDLVTLKINFNYQKKAVYHSFFGIFISICIYACLILLTQYFAMDFINKVNPNVTYQETQFTESESFRYPIKSLLDCYSYKIDLTTNENIYNLSSKDDYKHIYNQTNKFFSFVLIIKNSTYTNFLELIEKINISSRRNEFGTYDININNNLKDQKFNLLIKSLYPEIQSENNDFKPTYSKNISNLLFNDFNITIHPETEIFFGLKIKKDIPTIASSSIRIFNIDNVINVDDPKFFSKISFNDAEVQMDNNLNIQQSINYNYGVVKLIDDTGIFFSELNNNYAFKKNYESYFPGINGITNKDDYSINLIFRIQFNALMKKYQRIYKKLQNVLADLG